MPKSNTPNPQGEQSSPRGSNAIPENLAAPKKKARSLGSKFSLNPDEKPIPFRGEDFVDREGETGPQTYARWFAMQTRERQKELKTQGLAPESYDGRVDANWVFEVQPDHMAYSTDDREAQEFDEPEAPTRLYTEDDLLETIRRVVMAMQLSESPEVMFQARCILIAFGIGDPPTETELAKQKNCSRQFVSKKVKRIQQLFNLSPSQYMRSEQACKAYARAWQRNQERNKKTSEDTELPL